MASFRDDPVPLTSGNQRVKFARKLARRAFRAEHRLFLADGPKAVEGALGTPGCVVEVFATPEATDRYADLRGVASSLEVDWRPVDDRAMASLSDAVNPAGVLAVCRFVDRPVDHVLPKAVVEEVAQPATVVEEVAQQPSRNPASSVVDPATVVEEVAQQPSRGRASSVADAAPVVEEVAQQPSRNPASSVVDPATVVEEVAQQPSRNHPRLVTICADVRDPGNAGTVIRTSDAVGADAVLLAGHSVDAHNPKTVRATVGSLFHLPLSVVDDPVDAVRAARAAGLVVLAADGSGELDLDDAIDDGLLEGPTAWLFGNEAWGLPEELAALADHRVAIPIHGRAESLNLSTAAAVCLYASARAQRRRG